ncbi:MAG: hypothetical protein LDL44_04820, partial [Caenispirillum sp.]|nr:hypothetical protein [Caenispirillum sp.]
MDVARVGWQQNQPTTTEPKKDAQSTDWGALFAAAVANAAAAAQPNLTAEAAPPLPPRQPLTADRPEPVD